MGTRRLGWHDLLAFIQHLRQGSSLAISILGEKARWTDLEALLAAAVDALNGANWQRSGKKSGKPKPIPRPGTTTKGEEQRFGSDAVPVDEFDKWLAGKQRQDN